MMLKEFTRPFYNDKNLHAYKYGFAEEFDANAPSCNAFITLNLSIVFGCVGALSGGLPIALVIGIVSAVVISKTFVDFLALIVPKPPIDKVIKEEPNMEWLFIIGKLFLPTGVQSASSELFGRSVGKKVADDWNHKEIESKGFYPLF